jgi:hypothetical protein
VALTHDSLDTPIEEVVEKAKAAAILVKIHGHS